MTLRTKDLQNRLSRMVKRAYRNPTPYLAGVLLFAVFVGYTINMTNRRLEVDPSSCKPLLELIAQAESKGNYNAYFGNASNSKLEFTKMSIAQVLDWQKNFVDEGNPSSAVGKYQVINTTLAGLVDELDVDKTQLFDEPTQDKFAVALLERRGAVDYVNGDIDRTKFASELAKEWAGLPQATGDNPGQSYYDGDGLNKALVDVDEVLDAVDRVEPR